MIKNLLLVSLVSTSLYAAPNLVMESSSSKGKEQKALVFEKTDLLIVKNSNKYDSKPDYRLGKLRLKKSDELYQTEERLKQISMALVAAEKILNKKGSSFDKLNQNKNPHGDKIYLDQIIVTENSSYYEELKKIIEGLDTNPYVLEDGKKISKDKKQLETFKGGKMVSKEDFIMPFFCDEPKAPARCELRDAGVIYLR